MMSIRGCSLKQIRHISIPPRKSFISGTSPFLHKYFQILPNLKLGAGIIGSCLAIVNLHPNVLFTVLPPIGVLGYFSYKNIIERIYNKESQIAKQAKLSITIPPYDESSIEFDTEFDHFKLHALENVNQLILDNIEKLPFLLLNDQVNFKLGHIENFVVSAIDGKEFIKFGVGLYDKQKTIRIGIAEVYLLKNADTYSTALRIWHNLDFIQL